MKYLLGLVLIGGQIVTFLSTGVVATGLGGISAGALVGIAATWIAIISGYFHIRRSIVQDRDAAMKRTAEAAVRAEFAVRGPTFMDRREQEIINSQHSERYQTLTKFDNVAQELRHLTSALERAIAKDDRAGRERDGR